MQPSKTEPRVVLFDIESLPDLKEVMKVIPSLGDYPGLTLKATINSVICFGYKVWGEKETRCLNAWDYPAWKKDVNDDKALCEDIHKILSDADCFVTHNGKRFDLKFLQTRFIKHGLPPLPRTSHIDTCMEAKKNLLLFNNRLNTLAKFIKSEEKLENGGWDLWSKVLARDKKSMLLMEKYCKQDVVVLEAVFKKILPFVNSMPNFNLFSSGEKDVCPNCGSTRLTGNGQRVTKEAVYMRIRCADCGTSSQKRKPEKEPRTF